MIIFQASLNFDPVKEILKIRCQIYVFRGSPPEVFLKQFSEKMQQIYRRALMSKCDFN